MDENQKFDNLSKKMFDVSLKRNPVWATYIGLHQYDHLMPDVSREGYLEDIMIHKKFLKLFKNSNPQKLTPERKLDREIVIYMINLFLYQIEIIRQWESDPDLISEIGNSIFPLFVKDFAPFKNRIKSIISRLQKVPKFLESGKKRIKNPVKLWVNMAIESCERIPYFFEEIIKVAEREKLDKKTLNKVRKSVEVAKKSIDSYKKYLKENLLLKSKEEFAIGEAKFKKLIELRKLGMTPKEILDLGEKYLKDFKETRRKIAEKINPEASVEEVKREIEKTHFNNFEEILKAYRESIKKARKFIIEKGIVKMPPNEELKVIATPIFMRHLIPFAAYFPPAKFDKKQLGIYIVTPTEKGNIGRYNYPNIENTSVHEAYPGHHLQLACANTNPSLIRLFVDATEFVEGWAHYCEEYMKELGYGDTLEERFVQTNDMVWRAVRIVVDVKLHTGKMSFDEAIRFLMKEAGIDEEGATAEVKRYTQSPGYQLSYLLGKHLIKKLKEETKKEMGKKFSDKFFNNTLLYTGSIPIYFMKKSLKINLK